MLKLCYEARRICSKHISLTPLFLRPLASLVSEAKMGWGQLSGGIVDVEFKFKKKKIYHIDCRHKHTTLLVVLTRVQLQKQVDLNLSFL